MILGGDDRGDRLVTPAAGSTTVSKLFLLDARLNLLSTGGTLSSVSFSDILNYAQKLIQATNFYNKNKYQLFLRIRHGNFVFWFTRIYNLNIFKLDKNLQYLHNAPNKGITKSLQLVTFTRKYAIDL
jgi:hypothetical protein